jgi:alkylresorcinol/alkylpyrone synthase
MITVQSVTCLDMPYHYSTEKIVEVADAMWLSRLDEKTRRFALRLFQGANIKSRSSVVPIDVVFADLSFQEKNDLYIEAMISQGKLLLQKFFDEQKIDPKEIDFLITTSCTGFMIPSVDAYLVDHFGMRQDVLRLPVTEMGCAGGTSAMIYAHDFLQGRKTGKALLIALEFPGLTFQKGDLAPENLVSTAIFADGAACVLLEKNAPPSKTPVLAIKAHRMYHFPNATHLMGFNLINSGLKIVLHKDVPEAIEHHFPKIIVPFLQQQNISMENIQAFLFHPGGKKIIAQAENYLQQWGKDIPLSRKILSERGNMSSATVLHILHEYWRNQKNKSVAGENALMLAFGPGFMAQQLLLQWE